MNKPPTEGYSKATAHFVPKGIVPTTEQQAIQISPARVAIVEANAGASKTTVLALRMAEAWARHTRPEQILALTYTDAACLALKVALKNMGVPVAVIHQFKILTFEVFSAAVLLELEGRPVAVYTEAEQLSPVLWQAIERVADNPSEKWRAQFIMPTPGDHAMVDLFVQQSEYLKGTMLDVFERQEQPVTPDYAESIGIEYTQMKIIMAFEKIRLADYERPLFRGPSDATYDLAHLLHDGAELRSCRAWPVNLKVVVVDEMHDMNRAMFCILKEILASNRCFFCGVGDVDQVIHKANGADARFMREDLALLSTHTVVKHPLTHSFRFNTTVASLAGKLANKRYASKAPHPSKLTFTPYDSREDCARQVVVDAKSWRAHNKTKTAGCAILLRHPHQSVQIENALIEQNIPYETRGFKSYVLRPEVLFVRGLLAVATDDLSSVTESKTREEVMRALLFFSGSSIEVQGREHESQQDLLASAIRSVTDNPMFLTSFFDNQVLRNAPPDIRCRLQAALGVIRQPSGSVSMEAVLDALHVKSLLGNALVSQRRRLEAESNLSWLCDMAKRFDSSAELFQSLNATEQKQQNSKTSKTDSLLLASIASVKGLEFDCVLLPYLAHGEFPDPSSDMDEELNTLYVGITRVRKELTIYPSRSAPSIFMRRMGLDTASSPG
ncbi:MAG: ATP-dependent helicase [Rhodoferax sp.]|uniref:3'-5' exonuclease n=1 Tax=Rhodoferax sp. TaxID=50421 RepID=UPI00260A1CDD|nr:ATP-dependent helicase [Rhodoferax sp.]MDD2882345.1 ATP-dependent helicase [Rhodoferax sp.]